NATGRESEVKTKRHVHHDEGNGVQHRLDRGFLELLTRLGSNPFDAARRVGAPIGKLRLQLSDKRVGDADELGLVSVVLYLSELQHGADTDSGRLNMRQKLVLRHGRAQLQRQLVAAGRPFDAFDTHA